MTSSIKQHLRLRFPEWVVAAGLFIWGIIVLNSPGLFQSSDIYIHMKDIAPQQMWAVVAILIGLTRLVFLTINGTYKQSAHIRMLGSVLSICMWTAVWASYLVLDITIPNLATIGIIIALDFYSLWFASEDAKVADLEGKK